MAITHTFTWQGGAYHVCKSSSSVRRAVVVASTAPRLGRSIKSTSAPPDVAIGKRGLAAATFLSFAIFTAEVDSRTELLQKYLKKSEENKAKNDRDRQDSYYKRNYRDYFDLIKSSAEGKKEEERTEAEKAILEWLEKNK